MRYMREIMILTVSLALTGCATVEKKLSVPGGDTSPVYVKKAKTIPETKVPGDMSSANMQSYYPIPPVTEGGMDKIPSTLPPGSQAAQQAEQKQAQQEQRATAHMAATQASSNQVVSSSSSNTALVLNLSYPQAWTRVGQGLNGSGYQILQQDRSLGAYYVLDVAGSGGKLKTDTPIYQVRLRSSGNSTTVTLSDSKNQPASPAVASRILHALRGQL